MNLSINWLNEYTDTKTIPLDELVERLTMSGSKVEKTINLSDPLKKIVIGEVIEISRHENSDKLFICKVDVGDKTVQIVTGAQNVFKGAKVPAVLDGGVVIDRQNKTPLKIKKGKLRGEVSEGMLCSYDELGLEKADFPNLSENALDGILILNDEKGIDAIENGSSALEFLGLDDTVIEFEITNNRPDCFSITGLSKEVSITFDTPLNITPPKVENAVFTSDSIDDELCVTVENKSLCSRYMAGIVRDVKVAPSPKWLASRLKAQGIRPINNIVDITNYVMLEYGNPLHAFDKHFIEGGITVRNAKNGEEITLLDGSVVSLDEQTLIIADSKKPVAVAGVMGGEHSGINNDTNTVIIEAACFDGVSVRRASKKIGRRTESSSRFEKGLNPELTKTALLRALELITLLKCGTVCKTLIDNKNFEPEKKTIPFDHDKINALLGTDITKAKQLEILKKLGFDLKEVDGKELIVIPPERTDIKLSCDLAEEIARVYGYDKITPTLPKISAFDSDNEIENNTNRLAAFLVSQGCYECITYSFVSPKMAGKPSNDTPNDASADTKCPAIIISNPFGEETSVMRRKMFPSMLKVISGNLNSQNKSGRFFEIGRIYEREISGKPIERDTLCIGIYGENENFYTLKGIIDELLRTFKLNLPIERYCDEPFHSGRAASIGGGIITFGEISPFTLNEYDIDERIYIAEIDLEKLFKNIDDKITYTSIPEYPASNRDLSLVCEEETASGDIIKIIKDSSKDILEGVEFFDVFRGGNLSDNEKSISYKLTFRKKDGTLKDSEVDLCIEKILKNLEKNNIKIRG